MLVKDNGDYLSIQCPSVVAPKNAEDLRQIALGLIEKPKMLTVLDFKEVVTINEKIYNSIILLNSAIIKKNCFFSIINASNNIEVLLKAALKGSEVNLSKNIHEARVFAGMGQNKAEIYAIFVDPFVKATEKVLQMQCNLKPVLGKPYQKSVTTVLDMHVVGILSLVSKAFCGTIALCFSSSAFLSVYSGMFGEPAETFSEEMVDAAAEILNMIFGIAKAELNEIEGFQIEKSIPSVIYGEKMRLFSEVQQKSVIIPFKLEKGDFFLEISLKSGEN